MTVTLNCAALAETTARSVLGQEFADYEYLVKDGGSTDGTVVRLRALGVEAHVAPDAGVYSAMNHALSLARGEYVYFLNAGDTFFSPVVLERLEAEIDRSAALCYGRVRTVPGGVRPRPPAALSRYYLFRRNLNHQSWLARRDVYAALGGFDERYRYVADQEFLWRVVKGGLRTQRLDTVVAEFKYGGLSTRRSARTDVSRERFDLMRQYYTRLEIAVFGLRSLYFLNPVKAQLWHMVHGKLQA